MKKLTKKSLAAMSVQERFLNPVEHTVSLQFEVGPKNAGGSLKVFDDGSERMKVYGRVALPDGRLAEIDCHLSRSLSTKDIGTPGELLRQQMAMALCCGAHDGNIKAVLDYWAVKGWRSDEDETHKRRHIRTGLNRLEFHGMHVLTIRLEGAVSMALAASSVEMVAASGGLPGHLVYSGEAWHWNADEDRASFFQNLRMNLATNPHKDT
ncbi:MAG: hypothetical protein JSS31_18285 [Proteobacteria bacterium]|nr:hypothetical protein [Pseudomonadota bacterium]